jgi:hypothetical protein
VASLLCTLFKQGDWQHLGSRVHVWTMDEKLPSDVNGLILPGVATIRVACRGQGDVAERLKAALC